MGDAVPLSAPVWVIVGRTSLVYLAIVFLMRFAPKRRSGTISPNDIIALVLIGALAGDGIMGGANSVSDIMLMIGTVVAWGYTIDMLEYRSPLFQRLIREDETALIRDGRILWRNLRRERITKEELMAALREEGIEDPSFVKSACLEADGQISVVKAAEHRLAESGPALR